MLGWYRNLRGTVDAAQSFRDDLEPHAERLANLSRRILDVGGVLGLVREYFRKETDYVSLDPSTDWLADEWDVLAPSFACIAAPLQFVRAVAESMPFADFVFDHVLLLFSLNHCDDAGRALAEAARVLKPGATLFLVLEDMEPTWWDVLGLDAAPHWANMRREVAVLKLRALLKGWPVQFDHVRLSEAAIHTSTDESLELKTRSWAGPYLTLELQRR